MKYNIQLFGGRGASAGGAGSTTNTPSPTSTGGKLVRQSTDQWYGENDNGSNVTINNAGRSDINFYKYGSKQIYEVDRRVADNATADNPPRFYATTQAEAVQLAKDWLKSNK